MEQVKINILFYEAEAASSVTCFFLLVAGALAYLLAEAVETMLV
jgi:hypothetical protein